MNILNILLDRYCFTVLEKQLGFERFPCVPWIAQISTAVVFRNFTKEKLFNLKDFWPGFWISSHTWMDRTAAVCF